MTDTKPARRRRRLPGWWMWPLVLGPVGLIVWLRSADRVGDQGMTNVLSFLLAVLALLVLLVWFALARGYRRRTRLLTLLGLFVVVACFVGSFRFGFTGSMVPVLISRWDRSPAIPATVAPPAAGAVDLAVTGDDDFPGYLGPDRDQRVRSVELARDWTSTPPQLLWRQPIGKGWSGFAIVNDVAVTQEEREGRQMVTAYDAETGNLLWMHDWPGAFDHPMGGPGPRATPMIDDGLVYAAGPFGRLVCLDGSDGSPVWEVDLLDAYGIDPDADRIAVSYGRSGSPLVHDDMVIIPVGAPANLVAFDKKTGDAIWTGSNHQVSYSSPIVAELAGVEQVLIVNEDTVTGHELATGRLLWEHPWPGRSGADATASQAVPMPPSSVFVSKGYGVGAALLDLEPSADGAFAVRQRWHTRRSMRTKFTNVLVLEEHVYGLSDGMLECIDLERGRRAWKDGRYGHGQILGVGSLVLVLSEEGELLLIEPSPDEPNKVLGRVDALDGLTWNNLALAGDVLIVRNGQEAAAYRVAVETSELP